ncbi:MAG: hypothetical protein M1819_000163 [Sarea resinae]|nr:MAG: hypothetical protein M1819_000163 [Sarea resinae]
MSQQNNNQARQQQQQQTSYPSPHSYPSPSMSTYAYPPPQQQQNVEPYRASPTGSHVSLPSLNLPPIRAMDGQQTQQQQAAQQQQQRSQQQQQPGQPQMGSPLPPPVAPMGYYPAQGQLPPGQHPNVTSSPHNQQMRYPIPAPDGRIMSGGRHKKEIKRRTKTGCLTCRKRRIKCDEAHPTCRNCQKSKRECLGYDPIFKSQPGPAAIQPAPSVGPIMAAPIPTSVPAPSPYPPAPQGYAPAVSAGYAPPLSAGASSPGSSVEPYDYTAAIDPALEASAPTQIAGQATSYDGIQGFRPDLKGALDSASPYSTASDTQNQRGAYQSHLIVDPSGSQVDGPADEWLAHTYSPAKRIKIDDLLSAGGVVPPPLTPPSDQPLSITADMYDSIKEFYLSVYAPAIDKFLETQWFCSKGLAILMADNRLCDQMSTLINKIKEGPTVPDDLALTQQMEIRVIWSLMLMCRTTASTSNEEGKPPGAEVSVTETAKRLEIFENLVCLHTLAANPVESFSGTTTYGSRRVEERDFWRSLGNFITLHESDPNAAKDIESALSVCRGVLGGLENRDVLYSMAIARHLGPRIPGFPNNVQPVSNNEDDALNKVYVAKKFLEDEAIGKGTTQVIQRVCALAIRSWSLASSH